MKNLKTLLFVTIVTLLTISCTDTTENLVVKPIDHTENPMSFDGDTGFYDTGNEGDDDSTDKE